MNKYTRNRWRKRVLLISALMMGNLLFASDSGGAFMRRYSNPEMAALGQAGVSTLRGPNAQLLNPAGLAPSEEPNSMIQIMGLDAFGAQTSLVQAYTPVYPFGVGVSYLRTSLTGIPEVVRNTLSDRLEDTQRDLGYSGEALTLGVGHTYTLSQMGIQTLHTGINLKRVQEKTSGYRAVGLGVDLGVQALTKKGQSFGISALNVLRPEMKWNTPSRSIDTVPTVIQLSIGAPLTQRMTLISDLRLQNNRSAKLLLGTAYQLTETLVLRAGANESAWAIGTGLRFGPLGIDFAWVHPTQDALQDVYQVALNYKVGWAPLKRSIK